MTSATVSMAQLAAIASNQTVTATPVDTSEISGERCTLGYMRMAAKAQALLSQQQWPTEGFLHGSGLKDDGTFLPCAQGLKLLNGKIARNGEKPPAEMEIRLMAKCYPNNATMDDVSAAAVDVYIMCGRKGERRGKTESKRLCRLGFVGSGTKHGDTFLRGRPYTDEHQMPFKGYELAVHVEDIDGKPETFLILQGIR